MIVIVDYNLGNLFSVAKAFEMVGADVKISKNPLDLKNASRIVLPGVGAFGNGIDYLNKSGLREVLEYEVLENKKPFLGICLGLQLLADISDENGIHKGLGWIKGKVERLEAKTKESKIPHAGWNDLAFKRETPLFKGIRPNTDFYFIHSYMLKCENTKEIVATTFYDQEIVAAVQFENIFATQFHPEKSQEAGLKLLENFIYWIPKYA